MAQWRWAALKLAFVVLSSLEVQAVTPASSVPAAVWHGLNLTVGGRLHQAKPLSLPCFSVYDGKHIQRDASACEVVQNNYTSPEFRVERFEAYMMTQWETCQRMSQQCLLDNVDATNSRAWTEFNCSQGSVSPYYIEVEAVEDILAAYTFSQTTGVPLVIKNTGHDYKGRASSKDALALWTHSLKSMSYNSEFVPSGCTCDKVYPALTTGAGVRWLEAYEYADANNFTVVGGYHQTVGTSGGWLQGGGHSILTPVYGLGVDRVVELKVVTPDGVYRTANECQNQDLFWALRGGGGGTFGFVMESTSVVEPKSIPLQVASMSFEVNSTNQVPWLKLVVDNAYKWGTQGWGGHMGPNNLINVNPLLTLDEAKESVKDAAEYVKSQGGQVVIETQPSWYAFFSKYVPAAQAAVGQEYLLGSHLMATSLFTSDEGKTNVSSALANMLPYATPYIVVGTPFLFNETKNATSVNPAWYDSLWHLAFHTEFGFNSSLEDKKDAYERGMDIVQTFWGLAPDTGAYFNEGLVYEANHERSYWGENYERLLSLKKKYDPSGLLDCWQCVGWAGADDERYSCYLQL